MSTLIGQGQSLKKRASEAAMEAVSEALKSLGGREPDLLIVFATAHYDQSELIKQIKAISRSKQLVGCSGEGVIFKNASSESGFALSIMAISSDAITFKARTFNALQRDSRKCGEQIGEYIESLSDEEKKLAFIFPDGLKVNSTQLLGGISSKLSKEIPLLGGSAGDAMKLEATFQYMDGVATSDSVSLLVLGGDFDFQFAVNHGCSPLGVPRLVTEANGNTVIKVEDRPAWDVLKEYLPNPPEDLGGAESSFIALGQKVPRTNGAQTDNYVIHAPMHLDKGTGAVSFASEIAVGEEVLMTRRDTDLIASNALNLAKDLKRDEECLAMFQFDCAGRGRMLFGNEVDERVNRPLQDHFADKTPWIGLYTFGEIANISNRPHSHSYTVVLCALYAR